MDIKELKKLKRAAKMTNIDISDLSGIPVSTVNKIFSGATENPRYATLLAIMADTCGYEVGDFVHTFGDAHIYLDHVDLIKTQLEREPRKLPRLIIKNHHESVVDYKFEDFEIVDYDPYPAIKGKVSV